MSECRICLFKNKHSLVRLLCLSLGWVSKSSKVEERNEDLWNAPGLIPSPLSRQESHSRPDLKFGWQTLTVAGYLRGPYQNLADQQCQPEETDKQQWAKYKTFHQQCRQDESCMKRALIWKCDNNDFCGGLGDEIRGLTFTLYVAMATNRPFLVSWSRLGQDVLALFEQNEIDVSVPPGLVGCAPNSMIDWHGNLAKVSGLLERTKTEQSCASWVTNNGPDIFFVKENRVLLEPNLLWLGHVKHPYPLGCAMSFLFKPSSSKSALQPFAGGGYSVIHYRVADGAIGDKQENSDIYDQNIRAALQCAKKHGVSKILFLAASEAAKSRALEVSKGFGIQLKLSEGVAKHVDHDNADLSRNEFEAAVWNDFVAIQQAQYFFDAGRWSGFSRSAVSMAFMPRDKIFDNKCQASA